MKSETNSPLMEEERSHRRRSSERRKLTEKVQLPKVCAARRARTKETPGKSRKTLGKKDVAPDFPGGPGVKMAPGCQWEGVGSIPGQKVKIPLAML